MSKLVLAVTTFNRVNYLRKLVESFLKFRDLTFSYTVIIADDGSTDGTIDYLQNLTIDEIPLIVIHNHRQGVHHQFNTILKELQNRSFDVCFKCDDDIEFLRAGWERLYISGMEESGFDHLCHFEPSWRPEKNTMKPVHFGRLVSRCVAKDVQGAFFTLTPRVIKSIGFMDTKEFGFRGVGHIDYTLRAARAGFNHEEHPFDVRDSNLYIGHQSEGYRPAMNAHLVNALENDSEGRRKYAVIKDPARKYIEFYENAPSLTGEIEYELLLNRIDALEQEKQWYQRQYDHQPKWYVRLGKLFFRGFR